MLDRDIRHVEGNGTLWALPATTPGAFFLTYPGVNFMKSLDRGRSFVTESSWPADAVTDWMGVADGGSAWALASRFSSNGSRSMQWLKRGTASASWVQASLPESTGGCPLASLLSTPTGSWALYGGICSGGLTLWHEVDAAQGWTQRSFPDGVRVTSSGFVDDQTVYARVNQNGWPYVSVDAGRSWSIAAIGQALPDEHLFDGLQRDAGGLLLSSTYSSQRFRKSWFRSRDGGKSWNSLWSAQSRPESFIEIWFGNASRGLAITADGAVHASEDGGRSWRVRDPASLPGPSVPEVTVPFGYPRGLNTLQTAPGGTVIWAIAGGRLVRSLDQGQTWQIHAAQPSAPGSRGITDLRWLDSNRVYAVSSACFYFGHSPENCVSSLYRSDDGAETWRTVATDVSNCRRLYLSSALRGVCLDRGRSSYTSDGGATWEASSGAMPPFDSVFRVIRSAGGVLWSLSSSALLRSADEGRTWTAVALPAGPRVLGNEGSSRPAAFNDLVFAGPTRGWIVGERGLVLTTQDGGASWSRQYTAVQSHLTTAFALDDSTLWLGADNSILATATGGR